MHVCACSLEFEANRCSAVPRAWHACRAPAHITTFRVVQGTHAALTAHAVQHSNAEAAQAKNMITCARMLTLSAKVGRFQDPSHQAVMRSANLIGRAAAQGARTFLSTLLLLLSGWLLAA